MSIREFVCIDCGVPIVSFGYDAANDNPVCATCAWIRSIPDPVDRERLRVFLSRGDDNGDHKK